MILWFTLLESVKCLKRNKIAWKPKLVSSVLGIPSPKVANYIPHIGPNQGWKPVWSCSSPKIIPKLVKCSKVARVAPLPISIAFGVEMSANGKAANVSFPKPKGSSVEAVSIRDLAMKMPKNSMKRIDPDSNPPFFPHKIRTFLDLPKLINVLVNEDQVLRNGVHLSTLVMHVLLPKVANGKASRIPNVGE